MKKKPLFNVRWSQGEQVLRDPAQNKDAAFTRAERRRLGIEGLLPPAVLRLAVEAKQAAPASILQKTGDLLDQLSQSLVTG